MIASWVALVVCAAPSPGGAVQLEFYWGVGCPHCTEAKQFIDDLRRADPSVSVESIEIRQDAVGRARFIETVRRLGIEAPGIPMFVFGDAHVTGFQDDVTEDLVRSMLRGDVATIGPVVLPLVGEIDAANMSLPWLTVVIGLVDGINPCAIWVLLVLLGILTHVDSRARLFLYGGAFVLVSGVVYFLFMTIWVSAFSLVGISRPITIGLGAAIVVMGSINLKEVIWFKKGPSLMVPDKAKPKLYKRMRGIAGAQSIVAGLIGVTALAFVVNLIELGCTLGLPAVYTRILSLRADVGPAARYAYLALYNAVYIVPLGVIVAIYAATLHRLVLHERGAKVLKGVSGVLLVAFGLAFVFFPDALG